MRRQALWLWCLIALSGCEAKLSANISSTPAVAVTQRDTYVELKSSNLTAKVKRLETEPPTTISLMQDAEEGVSYTSLTEHDCVTRVSTLKYLAIYDGQLNLVSEQDNVGLQLDIEPGSLGEAELDLACAKGTHA